MKFPRRSGILLHPTSLPGPFGIGDLGEPAYRFVDFLAEAGQTYWQILPLGPTGYGDSPYQTHSAFAGNPMLISLRRLAETDHLAESDLTNAPDFPVERVNFGPVNRFKESLLEQAFATFQAEATSEERNRFEAFCTENGYWLDDFALFMALKSAHNLEPWPTWEPGLIHREPDTLDRWRERLGDGIAYRKYQQWQFFEQWSALKEYANEREVRIIGDIPIFVSMDSADAWANPRLFHFDEELKPIVVSGVPPDYFSETGQLWGHPLYRWDVMREEAYGWWIDRFRTVFTRADLARIDHFRGFYNFWAVPAEAETAVKGRWERGPGADFFRTVTDALGEMAIIAEDLGDFDEASRAGVNALQEAFGYPGMKVLQFAFNSGPENEFLPHNFDADWVVYTGTHDNDTGKGWYETQASEDERDYARKYIGCSGTDIAWDLIRVAWRSRADTAITVAQNLLSLGHEARMNTPGTIGAPNWCWRLSPDSLDHSIAQRLLELTGVYGRLR